jgi:hypothetical protein
MKVLVDTRVWSLALRRGRQSTSAPVQELRYLISANRVQIIGPIRQEILSGVREESQFKELEARLAPFPESSLVWKGLPRNPSRPPFFKGRRAF